MNPTQQPSALLRHLYHTAVKRGLADYCLPPHLDRISKDKIAVLGAGKAAAAMAKSIEDHFDGAISGRSITRYGHGTACRHIEIIEAAHPIPDDAGLAAAHKMLETAASIEADTQAVCLISGGASALLTLPHPAISFADKKKIHQQLILSGASIQEINCVRKHLSAVKGGRLMEKLYPAPTLTFYISDVVHDDVSVIGSGPTVADSTTCADALDILREYDIRASTTIERLLRSGQLETPKPDSPIFEHAEAIMIASAGDCLQAAVAAAEQAGIEAILLSDAVTADSKQAAQDHVRFLRRTAAQRTNRKPFIIVSGGETTVAVRGCGKGGPNTEFALALALELGDLSGICALACDTDGIDGSEDNAGALIHEQTLAQARAKNLNPRQFLENNDTYSFFSALDDLIMTGPTLTNVNDFRAIYCDPARLVRPL